jgi:hypothetical protein
MNVCVRLLSNILHAYVSNGKLTNIVCLSVCFPLMIQTLWK